MTSTESSTTPSVAAPAGGREHAIDALRGFALLGILMVNAGSFASTYFGVGVSDPAFSRPVDHAVRWLVSFFFETKFYLLFSMLFGYSFALQMDAARRTGSAFVPRFLRRLLGLALLGVAHAWLLFAGDMGGRASGRGGGAGVGAAGGHSRWLGPVGRADGAGAADGLAPGRAARQGAASRASVSRQCPGGHCAARAGNGRGRMVCAGVRAGPVCAGYVPVGAGGAPHRLSGLCGAAPRATAPLDGLLPAGRCGGRVVLCLYAGRRQCSLARTCGSGCTGSGFGHRAVSHFRLCRAAAVVAAARPSRPPAGRCAATSGAHGTDELPAAVAGGGAGLYGLRPGAGGPGVAGVGGAGRAGAVRHPAGVEPPLDGHACLWSGGMAAACYHAVAVARMAARPGLTAGRDACGALLSGPESRAARTAFLPAPRSSGCGPPAGWPSTRICLLRVPHSPDPARLWAVSSGPGCLAQTAPGMSAAPWRLRRRCSYRRPQTPGGTR